MLTYDGIEVGGERVAQEVEEKLEELEAAGNKVRKLSFVGYSLGGIIARYAIGLLYNRGWFDKLEPVNFTTFASPHLGSRTPLVGYHNQLWNVVGARMLSMSGRQLFLVDDFRGTGRPLFAILADPSSIFMKALARFRHKSLYCNIVNDRSVVYYTAAISKIDPYVRMDDIKVNYVPGYDNVIVDSERPVSPRDEEALHLRLYNRGQTLMGQAPFFAFLMVFFPLASVLFSINSVFQNAWSQKRIQLHEEGKLGIKKGTYHFPLMLQDVRRAAEDVYENVANTQAQEYLPEDSEEASAPSSPLLQRKLSRAASEKFMNTEEDELETTNPPREVHFPTLALTKDQFAMVEALDQIGWKKYPVHIHNAHHSHAGIIVRMAVKRFDEGKIVVRHWLERFEI